MRIGQTFTILLVVFSVSSASLTGQENTNKPAYTAQQTMSINGSVWMKNPFSERNVAATPAAEKGLQEKEVAKSVMTNLPEMEAAKPVMPQSVLSLPTAALKPAPSRPEFEDESVSQSASGIQPKLKLKRVVAVSNETPVNDANDSYADHEVRSNGQTINDSNLDLDDILLQQQESQAGPLDQFVRNTSGVEEIKPTPITRAETLPVKPIPRTGLQPNSTTTVKPRYQPRVPKVAVEQTSNSSQSQQSFSPTAASRTQGVFRKVNVVNPRTYTQPPYYNETAHIHEEARLRNQAFDPSQCNSRQTNNHDLSGCYDEWGNFCNPRRLDWECDCQQFPRREDAAPCRACQAKRGLPVGRGILKQGLQKLACGCQGTCHGRCKLLNINIKRRTSSCEQCGNECNNQCDCSKGNGLLGNGLLQHRPATATAVGGDQSDFDFGNPYSAVPKQEPLNIASEKTPQSLFSALRASNATETPK